MARKRFGAGRRGVLIILLGVILIAWSAVRLLAMDSMLQYMALAPAPKPVSGTEAAAERPNAKLAELLERLDGQWAELSESVSAHALSADAYEVALTGDGGLGAQAKLTAVCEGWLALYPRFLRSGRAFYPEELSRGARVMLLDEDLALKLFAVSEPIDRIVTIGEAEYRVVGIVRHKRGIDERAEYAAYIPLSQALAEPIAFDTVTASAAPIARSGASSAFSAAMEALDLSGEMHDLDKEVMRALMLVRLTLFGAGLALAMAALRGLRGTVARLFARDRERLKREYFRDMLPGIALRTLLLLLAFAALIGGLFLLAGFVIQPVYTFPEWVPAVLVEWTDIAGAFWALVKAFARPVRLYSPQMIAIRYYGVLVHWGLILTLGGCFAASVLKKKGEE